jgi:hypothetical protein
VRDGYGFNIWDETEAEVKAKTIPIFFTQPRKIGA